MHHVSTGGGYTGGTLSNHSNRTVLIARHGETPSNLARRYAGWSDEGLTHRGRQQAADLGRRLERAGVTRVRTSLIARAHQTALVVAEVLGVPTFPDERLNEMKMGSWEGLTEDEVASWYPAEHSVWTTRPDELVIEGRETLRELSLRAQAVLLDSGVSGHRELLVSHVAIVRVAVLLSEGRGLSEYKQVHVPNCQCFDVLVYPPVAVAYDEARVLQTRNQTQVAAG